MSSNWFLFAILAPLLWGLVNHADRFLLSKSFKGNGIGTILIFSALFSCVLVFIIGFVLKTPVFDISLFDGTSLIFIGGLSTLGFYCYLAALDEEEASVVVPFLQLGPIFGYLLGYLILGELLALNQILASILILMGVVVLSFDFDIDNNIKFKRKMILLMVFSAVFFSLHDVLFKQIALRDEFWVSTFWQYMGVTFSGLFIYIFVPKFRRQFVSMFKTVKPQVFSINIISETFYLAANLASNFAMLLAPVALVLVVSSYQPLFVFLIGVILTIFLPNVAKEKISGRHLVQKIVSIIIIIVGSLLLYSSTGN